MKKRLYISNDEAGFFDNNKMLCLDNPPTQGDFIVGDIVISNKQENGVFGWVCVLAGSPGRWEVINDLRLIQEAVEKLEQRQESIVNGDLTTIKNQITQMAEQALILDKEHKDELSKITEKVSTNTTNILNINTELDNIKQTASNLQGSVDQVVAGINAQVQTNKNNIQINSDRIAVLEGKQVNNEKEIQDIKTFVGLDNEEGEGPNLQERLEELENLVGKNDDGNEIIEGPILEEIKKLKERIDINDEADEVSREAILEELTEIRQIVGLENKEDGEPSLQERLDELEDLIGKNAEDGEQAIGNIVDEITDIKEVLGTSSVGEDIPGSGLIKEVEEIREEMLKYWVGTQEEYDALESKEIGRLYIIIK